MAKVLFWFLLVLGIYPYVIYPVLVTVLGRLRRRDVRADARFQPRVTVITAAYNEARHIGPTVRNKLTQDYPADRLEIIVVSDASSDATDQVVAAIAASDKRLRLLRNEARSGKTAALNLAVPQARGDIIVFADANSIYRPDTVRRL